MTKKAQTKQVSPPQQGPLPYPVLMALLYLLAYIGLDRIPALILAQPLLWHLPAGLTLALLIAGGLRYLPVTLVAAVITELAWPEPQIPAWISLLSAVTQTVGLGLSAAWLLYGVHISPRLRAARDVTWFTLSTLTISLFVTIVVIGGLVLIDTWLWTPVISTLFKEWGRQLIGVMTLAPFLLSCFRPWISKAAQCLSPSMTQREMPLGLPLILGGLLEITAEVINIAITLWIVFGSRLASELHLGYLCFVPLLWLALRYGLPRVTVSLVLLNVGVAIASQYTDAVLYSTTELQILLLALACTGLFVGAVVRARREGQEEIKAREERLQRQARELAMLNHTARTFSASLNLDQVLATVLEETRQQMDAMTCSLWLQDETTGELVCRQATGPQCDVVRGWRLPPGEGLVGWVVQHGESLITGDATTDPRHYTGVDAKTGLALRAMLTVPLEFKQKVIGALQMAASKANRFSAGDLRLLESFAASAAIAIENATLYDKAQQEIAERKQTEQALRESETRFRLMANTAPVLIWMSNAQGECTYFNQPWLAFRGRRREQEQGDGWVEGVHPEDREHCLSTYRAALASQTPFSMEYRLQNAQGEYHWIFDKGAPRFQEDGQFAGFIGACTDVTALKATEQALRQTERDMSIILNATSELFAYYNTELELQWANRAAGASVGEPAEALVGRHCYEIWHQTDVPCEGCPLLQAKETGKPQEGEMTTPDGRIWHVRGYPVLEGGEFVGLVEFGQDITERQRAVARVEHEAQRAGALLRIAARLNRVLALDDLLETLCEESVRALNVPAASVLLYDAEQQHFTLQTHIGLPKAYEREFKTPGRATYHQFIGSNNLIMVPDAATTPDLTNYDLHRQHHVRTIVGVPIAYEDELLGILTVNTFYEMRTFTDDELALLRGVADQAAQAIINAQLFEQVQAGQQRLEQLSKRLVNAQETERRHLARELHDEIGQALTVLKINIQAIQSAPDPTTAHQHLNSSLELVEQTLQQVRDLSLALRPSLLDDLGLVPALRWFLDHQAQQAGVTAHFTANEIGQELPPELEIAYYRIAQEAMTNIMRHAQAENVYVTLQKRDGLLQMTIWDDGIGFDVAETLQAVSRGTTSLGLLNMQERAQIIDGHLEITSTPGEGTVLSIVADIDRENQEPDARAHLHPKGT